jgi:hypothetical protein
MMMMMMIIIITIIIIIDIKSNAGGLQKAKKEYKHNMD